jgi:magnesium chelatase family protein
MPEMPRTLLETLRQPLEDGRVTISRASLSLTFPSRFMLVGAMNPCPCGYYGDSQHRCTCSIGEIQRYRQRLSGPLLDRVDITLEVARLPVNKLAQDIESPGEASMSIKERVMSARSLQRLRNLPVKREAVGAIACAAVAASQSLGVAQQEKVAAGFEDIHPDQTVLTEYTEEPADSSSGNSGSEAPEYEQTAARGVPNAALSSRQVRKYCKLSEEGQALLARAVDRLGLSARAYERIRKVARTIADLDGSENIEVPHLAEAIQYRSGEERLRG